MKAYTFKDFFILSLKKKKKVCMIHRSRTFLPTPNCRAALSVHPTLLQKHLCQLLTLSTLPRDGDCVLCPPSCLITSSLTGNLTKHMKSKAHSKKCLEMGVSVSLDDQDGEDSGNYQPQHTLSHMYTSCHTCTHPVTHVHTLSHMYTSCHTCT